MDGEEEQMREKQNNQGLLGILAVLTQFHTHKFPQIAARLRMKAFPEPGNAPSQGADSSLSSRIPQFQFANQ